MFEHMALVVFGDEHLKGHGRLAFVAFTFQSSNIEVRMSVSAYRTACARKRTCD